MRFFNFLLASDAVGGLGPPADLVKPKGVLTPGMLICIIILCMLIIAFIIIGIYTKDKNNNEKGDE